MHMRGIRGATTIKRDNPVEILSATKELLMAILEGNPTLKPEDMASAIFTVTEDIVSGFPAKAAREIGWTLVPLICMREIPVPDSLPLCIRVLIHWNTDLSQSGINHIYLGEARKLRPDLKEKNS